MLTDPRQIRRLGVGVFEVDSVFYKNAQPGAYIVYAPGWLRFDESRVDLEKSQPRTSYFT